MSRAVAVGDERRLAGYALAGAEVVHAASPADAEAAWARLPDDVGLLVLTRDSFATLGPRLSERNDLVSVVLPE